ncbi:MAG: DNA recombination protein RmuC [Candidatus Omnitrophota bacterium]
MAILITSMIWVSVVLAVALVFSRKIKDKLVKDNEDKINVLRSEWSDTLSRNTQLILDQMNEARKLSQDVNSSINNRLDNATKTFGDVQKSLGYLGERAKEIYEIGKDISSLQEILRAPKMRGGLGELFLENLLGEILPHKDLYELQYNFKSGERVDAVIKIGNKLVSVDSKFPLESFRRFIDAKEEEDKKRFKREFVKAVKDHIDSIAAKYILPDENTYDFALMYIPAENVYYEAIIKDDNFADGNSIFSQAISKKVIPVSPNSFYAYLQVIILGIRGLRIEKDTQAVIKMLGALKVNFYKFREEFSILGSHIEKIKSSYDRSDKRLDRFENKLSSIDSFDKKKEPKEIE